MSKNTQTEAPMQKKNVGYRIIAALFFLACVAVLFLPISTFTSAWVLEEQTLLETFKAMFASEAKLFGVLPALVSGTGSLELYANLAIYLFAICLVVTLFVSLFAILSRKSAPRRTRLAILFFTIGCAVYATVIYTFTSYTATAKFDLITSALTAAGMVAFFILAVIKVGKGAWISGIQFLLSAVFAVLLILSLVKDRASTDALLAANAIFASLVIDIVLLAFLNLLVAAIRTMSVKGFAFDVVRYILQLLFALGACYVYYAGASSLTSFIFVVGAALVALVQIVIAILQLINHSRKNVKKAKEEVLSGFDKEAYVEAYAYEGGPVAGVELAEEVTPTMAAANGTQPDLPSLVGNGFDPFMSTLSVEEKSEFIDLYILRCKGLMPEIPGYVVGEKNKEFFNCVFIYLGQYRDKISSTLLQKMYDYSMKL